MPKMWRNVTITPTVTLHLSIKSAYFKAEVFKKMNFQWVK